MGVVIEFRQKDAGWTDEDPAPDIDLITAVDAAIRDLRDIARNWGEADAREQAEACRRMLERAFDAAS